MSPAPVWALSVDLQTKTAVFQSGLADAARSARGAFTEIKTGAGEVGSGVGYSMGEARHSVMLLGEEFGVHLPRALTSFIAGLGPIGPALEMAFPFLAIAVGATLLIEHLAKLHEAGELLTTDQMKFAAVVNNAFNSLDDKLLQAQIRTDELNHNHLGALQKQLEIIDHESMSELVHSFEEVAKAGDVVMKELEGHWYSFGKGSEGAKHAVDDFRAHYELLLSTHKDEDADKAAGLLRGTMAQAQKALGLLQQIQSAGRQGGNPFAAFADPAKFHAAADELERMGIAFDPDHVATQVAAQQNVVDVLNSVALAAQRAAQIKSVEGGNIKTADAQADARDAKERQRQLEENLKEGREVYLKELFATYKETVAAVQQGEKQNIEATKEGTAERLQAIEDAMQREEADGLQGTAFYRELYAQRAELEQKLADDQVKLAQKVTEEKARALEQDVQEEIRHQKELELIKQGGGGMKDAARIALERQAEDMEYQLKAQGLEREQELYREAGMQETAEARKVQQQIDALNQEHADKTAEFAKQQISVEKTAALQVAEQWSQSFLSVAMGRERLSKLMVSSADQALSHLLQGIFQQMEGDKLSQLSSAKAAAAGAWSAMSKIPVVGPELGAVAAAATFAGALAFEMGTDRVPGIGNRDTVPAMLSPGEGVVPGGVMDNLAKMAREGGFQGGGTTHVMHYRPTFHVQTIDADGVREMLDKHTEEFSRHFYKEARRGNH